MTFRTRLLLTFLAAVIIPMVSLALFIRGEMTQRLTKQYERRVEALASVLEEDLLKESRTISAALTVMRGAAANDNRFRQAAVDGDESVRRYLLDYAGNAMQLTGLSFLQLQDARGRILSSGHFRNEYDRLEPALPRMIASAPQGFALIEARAPDAPFLALASVDSFQLADRQFYIVAGIKVGKAFLERLSRDDELTLDMIYPGGELTSHPRGSDRDTTATAITRNLRAPFVHEGRLAEATFRISHATTELDALRRSVDRWFLAAVAATAILAVLLVTWLASRISRPLSELADKTARVDLDHLDVDFDTSRRDEIGKLSRLLGAMTDRLRTSAVLIKDAERRATLGDVARQVNHDIKNGLTPLRNVFRHLTELANEAPGELPAVFAERRQTLDSSMTYLENLATNYARLSPRRDRQRCNVNIVVENVVADLKGTGDAQLSTHLGDGAFVTGDLVSIRRILENLVSNAVDSLEAGRGTVTVSTERVSHDGGARVRIVVGDTGAGMDEEHSKKAFDDFYTTKDNGTGLGLSIVRRLVMDLDGTIHLQSKVGSGTEIVVDLPAAEGVG